MNIFLRDCFYNAYLRDAYGLAVAEPWFEVPLDSVVAEGLKKNLAVAQASRTKRQTTSWRRK